MEKVYVLLVEDPWDEYYEQKLHSVFLTQEEATYFANTIPVAFSWSILEVPLGFDTPKLGDQLPNYPVVNKRS